MRLSEDQQMNFEHVDGKFFFLWCMFERLLTQVAILRLKSG